MMWADMPVTLESNWAMLHQPVTLGMDSYLGLDYQDFRVVVNKPSMLVISPMHLMRPMARSTHHLVSYRCSMLQNKKE